MEVVVRIEGRAGRITLNRPAALNALTHGMSLTIERALDDWRDDPAVAVVVIDAAGEKAFCAGGDVATLYRQITTGDAAGAQRFWSDEYRMNAKLAAYPKPVVTLMQGFVMGGGVGVGCHASHRVVGASSRVAMPECGIGLIPDVGGTWLLAHAPGQTGRYLGLTGARMGPGDAIFAGFADTCIPEAEWPALIGVLASTGDAGALRDSARPPPAAPLADRQGWIDRFFGSETVPAIMSLLASDGSDEANAALAAMRAASPLSLSATLEAVRRARTMSLREALAQEYRFTWRAPEHSDFAEGIRALIVDKDRMPRWRHPAPEMVREDETSAMLAPLGAAELNFGEETNS